MTRLQEAQLPAEAAPLRLPEIHELDALGGQAILRNTTNLPGEYGSHTGWQHMPHQSWDSIPTHLRNGVGLYLTMDEGSWRVELFAFDEEEPPEINRYALSLWDTPFKSPTTGHKEHYFGGLELQKYGEAARLCLVDRDSARDHYISAEERAHQGQEVLVVTSPARGWVREPNIGEGVLRSFRPADKPTLVTTRLYESAGELVAGLGQFTEGRLSERDRALFWGALEDQLTAMGQAKVSREAFFEELKRDSRSQPPRGETRAETTTPVAQINTGPVAALAALVRRVLPRR